MKKLFNKLKSNKGSIAIIGIIMTIIVVTLISGFLNMNNITWVSNEIQSILDVSTTTALQACLDDDKLRKEILEVDGTGSYVNNDGTRFVNNTELKAATKIKFEESLNKHIKTNEFIKDIDIVRFDATLQYSNWGSNFNGTQKYRPQLTMDATVLITFKGFKEFDGLDSRVAKIYDAKNNRDVEISVAGVNSDGNYTLMIRTLSRLIYR